MHARCWHPSYFFLLRCSLPWKFWSNTEPASESSIIFPFGSGEWFKGSIVLIKERKSEVLITSYMVSKEGLKYTSDETLWWIQRWIPQLWIWDWLHVIQTTDVLSGKETVSDYISMILRFSWICGGHGCQMGVCDIGVLQSYNDPTIIIAWNSVLLLPPMCTVSPLYRCWRFRNSTSIHPMSAPCT